MFRFPRLLAMPRKLSPVWTQDSGFEQMADALREDFFTSTISRDLFDLVIGPQIGSGFGRLVFEYLPDKSKVIKVELKKESFQNVIEWETWEHCKDTSLRSFLAPCHSISGYGSILIQTRTLTPPKSFKWPKRMPAFLCDFKHQNYGLIGRRLVCHDYGLLSGRESLRTKAARWWSTEDKE